MGDLIPNPLDQEIILKLNHVFSGKVFQKLKNHRDTDNQGPFSEPAGAAYSKRLSRAARRIGAYPKQVSFGNPNPRNPRARWYVFLDSLAGFYDIGVNPANPGASSSTEYTIKKVLSDALQDTFQGAAQGNIAGVVFNVSYQAVAAGTVKTIYVEPSNSSPGHLHNVPGTGWVVSLTLVVQDEMTNYGIGMNPHHQNNPAGSELFIPGLPWPDDNDNQ